MVHAGWIDITPNGFDHRAELLLSEATPHVIGEAQAHEEHGFIHGPICQGED
jgi:hypothetical protein